MVQSSCRFERGWCAAVSWALVRRGVDIPDIGDIGDMDTILWGLQTITWHTWRMERQSHRSGETHLSSGCISLLHVSKVSIQIIVCDGPINFNQQLPLSFWQLPAAARLTPVTSDFMAIKYFISLARNINTHLFLDTFSKYFSPTVSL